MDAEVRRLQGRAQQWTIENERNKDARRTKDEFISSKREETQRLEGQHQGSGGSAGRVAAVGGAVARGARGGAERGLGRISGAGRP